MNKQKTVLDFVAKMRGLVKPGETIEHTYEMLNGMADCFEAAYKLEIDALKSSAAPAPSGAIGNAAKLREALEKIKEGIMLRRAGLQWYKSDSSILDIVEAALAAPARNCDRPECATTKAAQDVWRKEDGGSTAYYAWLLALATEKEGGVK